MREAIVVLFWVLALLSATAGLVIGVGGFLLANGAPQEASAAATGLLVAVAPYTMARAVEKLALRR